MMTPTIHSTDYTRGFFDAMEAASREVSDARCQLHEVARDADTEIDTLRKRLHTAYRMFGWAAVLIVAQWVGLLWRFAR